jgi:two-component system, NtrC family, response regulator GlrR
MVATNDILDMTSVVGASKAFSNLVQKLPIISKHDVTILITGETGTGKEVIARAIHELGLRKTYPFCVFDCGAVPNDLIENELFGHERGAYTSANMSQSGIIKVCEGGTLFIDEIGNLPLSAQVKLLRLLQCKEYRPIGSPHIHLANVRIIAATNIPLTSLIKSGRFRQDLYYRLNVIPLRIPPLRERIEDIPVLAEYFLRKYCEQLSKNIIGISSDAMLKLTLRYWPGNVRELEHVIERAVVFCTNDYLSSSDIEFDQEMEERHRSLREEKAQLVANFEKNYLESLLSTYNGNVTHAASVAGKNRRAFIYLLRKYNIEPNRFRTIRSTTNEV